MSRRIRLAHASRVLVGKSGRFLACVARSFRGSSRVATRAPKRFAGTRRPRPLMHGTVHAIVSPKRLSRWKTDASRFGKTIGNSTGILRFAGPFNFFQASQIFVFIARKIL